MVTLTTRTVEEYTTSDGKTFTSGVDAMKHENNEAVKLCYSKPFGIWHVTTEADEEGRYTTDLGIHQGYLDDIAFFLADKVYRVLRFKAVVPMKHESNLSRNNIEKVSVMLDYDSGTWNSDRTTALVQFRKLLGTRNVAVNTGNFNSSVTLSKIK